MDIKNKINVTSILTYSPASPNITSQFTVTPSPQLPWNHHWLHNSFPILQPKPNEILLNSLWKYIQMRPFVFSLIAAILGCHSLWPGLVQWPPTNVSLPSVIVSSPSVLHEAARESLIKHVRSCNSGVPKPWVTVHVQLGIWLHSRR